MLTIAKPYLTTLRTTLAVAIVAGMLAACGGGKWGFPYRPDVQQGNWVTAEDIDRLEPGMSREQVRYLLGTPTLQNVFRDDRWDYPYYNKPGYGTTEQRRFTVWFEGDTLVRWSGDDQPEHQPFHAPDSTDSDSDTEEQQSPVTEPTPTTSGGLTTDSVVTEPLEE